MKIAEFRKYSNGFDGFGYILEDNEILIICM